MCRDSEDRALGISCDLFGHTSQQCMLEAAAAVRRDNQKIHFRSATLTADLLDRIASYDLCFASHSTRNVALLEFFHLALSCYPIGFMQCCQYA